LLSGKKSCGQAVSRGELGRRISGGTSFFHPNEKQRTRAKGPKTQKRKHPGVRQFKLRRGPRKYQTAGKKKNAPGGPTLFHFASPNCNRSKELAPHCKGAIGQVEEATREKEETIPGPCLKDLAQRSVGRGRKKVTSAYALWVGDWKIPNEPRASRGD